MLAGALVRESTVLGAGETEESATEPCPKERTVQRRVGWAVRMILDKIQRMQCCKWCLC